MATGVTTWIGRRSASQVVAALGAAGVHLGPGRRERAVLLDTFDGRLHDAGLRLSWHPDDPGSDPVTTADGDAPTGSLVLHERGSPDARLSGVTPPRWPDDLPPGPFRARLARHLDVRALLPMATIESTRSAGHTVGRDGKQTARVVLHRRPRITDADRAVAAWLVEVHPLVGYDRAADRLGDALDDLLGPGRPGDVVDLVVDRAGIDLGGVDITPTVAMLPDEPAAAAVQRVVAHLLTTVVDHWDGTASHVDPEFLHDLRVAVRRARSVLSETGAVLDPTGLASARTLLGRLATATGPSRDLDVLVLEWPGYVDEIPTEQRTATAHDLGPARSLVDRHRRKAHDDLTRVLTDEIHRDTVVDLRDDLAAGRLTPADGSGDGPLGPVVARRLRRAHRRLLRHGRAITAESPDEQLHDLRKDAKRLRYLLECFGGVLDPAGRKAAVGQLKALQELLGTHQDAAVHAAELRAYADELVAEDADTSAVLALGRVVDVLEHRRHATREEFAARFAGYDTKESRRTVRDLADALDLPTTAATDERDDADATGATGGASVAT